MKHLLLVLFMFIGFQLKPLNNSGKVIIVIEGLKKIEGNIAAMIFNQAEGFPDNPEYAIASQEIKVVNDRPVLVFSDLPYGEYAVSLIHDVNGNRTFDKNFIGIPTEPFGFSNNNSVITGPPKFKEAAFKLNSGSYESTIKLVEIF